MSIGEDINSTSYKFLRSRGEQSIMESTEDDDMSDGEIDERFRETLANHLISEEEIAKQVPPDLSQLCRSHKCGR